MTFAPEIMPPAWSLTNPEIWVLSDCAKLVIEIASDNAASNPNPRLFATTLLILVLILILPLREGRKGVAPSPSSLHDRRPQADNQKTGFVHSPKASAHEKSPN
jgi:hypothetical protein